MWRVSSEAKAAWRFVVIEVAEKDASFSYRLDRDKRRKVHRREGRYLLRTNLTEQNPAKLRRYYLQLVAVEEAFKNLEGDLALGPIHHQKEERIEAHIFIAFLAYCLHATLGCRLQALAPGLTPRSVIDKFVGVQMIVRKSPPPPTARRVVQPFASRLLRHQGLRFCQLPQSAKSA